MSENNKKTFPSLLSFHLGLENGHHYLESFLDGLLFKMTRRTRRSLECERKEWRTTRCILFNSVMYILRKIFTVNEVLLLIEIEMGLEGDLMGCMN